MVAILNFNDPESVSKVIAETETGIYGQANLDDSIITRYIILQQNQGLTCHTVYTNKPMYIECVSYDANGYQTEVCYEPAV